MPGHRALWTRGEGHRTHCKGRETITGGQGRGSQAWGVGGDKGLGAVQPQLQLWGLESWWSPFYPSSPPPTRRFPDCTPSLELS